MKQRSPLAVIGLTIITFGIYGIVWQVKTKNEMNSLGAEIPTAWLLIVPIVQYYWLWKYCAGVEKVTNGRQSQVLSFVLLFLIGIIGMAILQSEFNKVGTAVAGGVTEAVPAGPNPYAPATPATDMPQAPTATVAPQVIAPTAGNPTDPTTPQV